MLNISMDNLFVESIGFYGNLVFGLCEHKLHDPDPGGFVVSFLALDL